MGYAYGHLLADDNYYSLLCSLLGGKTVDNEITIEVLGLALYWQWNWYVSHKVSLFYVMFMECITLHSYSFTFMLVSYNAGHII